MSPTHVPQFTNLLKIFGLLSQRPNMAWAHPEKKKWQDFLYREMSVESKPVSHPKLNFKDILKQDLKKIYQNHKLGEKSHNSFHLSL